MRPGLAPCPQRMGIVLVREAHAGQPRGVRSLLPPRPLPCAPLCTGGVLCALWGRQRAGPQGSPGWGLWSPQRPAQLGGRGCSTCPGEPRLGSPACTRCQAPARSPARGLKPASRGRRRGRRQWRGAQRSSVAAEAGLCAKGSRKDLDLPGVPHSLALRSCVVLSAPRDQNLRSPRAQVGLPRGGRGGAGCRG